MIISKTIQLKKRGRPLKNQTEEGPINPVNHKEQKSYNNIEQNKRKYLRIIYIIDDLINNINIEEKPSIVGKLRFIKNIISEISQMT